MNVRGSYDPNRQKIHTLSTENAKLRAENAQLNKSLDAMRSARHALHNTSPSPGRVVFSIM